MSGLDDPDPTTHRRRLQRVEGRNHGRFLTFSCFRRRPLLRSERACQWLLSSVERARALHGFHLWAFVFMPEHAHVLLYPDPRHGSRISPVLTSIKQPVSRRAAAWLRRNRPEATARFLDVAPSGDAVFRFWQRGAGYDRNLWSARHVWDAIEYMHRNPVEAGLCARPEDWPWSSAKEYAQRGSGPLRIDFDSIPRLSG